MTCANWGMTILALIIFGAAIWPGIGGGLSGAAAYAVVIAVALIVVLAWTGVECKKCQNDEKKSKA